MADMDHLLVSGEFQEFLPKTRRILERPLMLFRPFGKDIDGTVIRDMTGVSIRSNVEHLEEYVTQTQGPHTGEEVVETLVKLLNERIPDRSYHVTSSFLRNPWTCYSNEFTAYLVEFCIELSRDNDFQFRMGRKKLIPPIMQTLMRPFSVKSIYKGATRWIEHYAKDSYDLQGIEVRDGYAILRMTLMDRALKQFGPYRRACAKVWCNALKVGISIVPQKIHGLEPAAMLERKCIVEGDDFCEWQVRWKEPIRWYLGKQIATNIAHHVLRHEIVDRDRLIEEQTFSLKTRHEELEKAYVELQQTAVELRKRVDYLTTLYEAGLQFTSSRDSEVLLQHALEILIDQLSYDRVMISFFDSIRKVSHNARVVGVTDELAAFARSLEIPVTDPLTIEGTVLLHGSPVLVQDVHEVLDRLHPLHRELVFKSGTQSFVSVPLKTKNGILGSLTVDRNRTHSLSQDDLEIMTTFANQLAIAIDNVTAYSQIEQLNLGLEQKVLERTAQLEAANEQLRELNQLKSAFVSVVSHELRTPMTSIRVYAENMLDGLIGSLNDEQSRYLTRILFNVDRLTRLSTDLLDLSKIESGKVELRLERLSFDEVLSDIVEGFRHSLKENSIALNVSSADEAVTVHADRDKLAQIFTNLFSNAIKFTTAGGKIQILTKVQPDGYLYIRISDTGCGIAPQELPKVFEKFFRGESTPSGVRGAGLGLAIVKSLVELHGGTIGVESTVGQGSAFFFTVPTSQTSVPTLS